MKLFIGIPSVRHDVDFLKSMEKFLPAIGKVHEVYALEVRDRKTDEARSIIADKFIESECSHLLFLDDDHSNHTPEMLEALIKADAYVCALKCYCKGFPYMPNLMQYNSERRPDMEYEPIMNKSGYVRCDLVGFGMTLIKKETFFKISKPYFACDQNGQKEDNYFCKNLLLNGIEPIGCCDYVLTHCGVDDSNVEELEKQGIQNIYDRARRERPGFEPKNLLLTNSYCVVS